MNEKKLANALRKLGEASYELADALFESPAPVSAGGPGAAVSPAAAPASLPPSIDELPFEEPLNEYEAWEQFDKEKQREAQPNLGDVSTEFADQGSEAICPKHRVPYADGKYGKYCQRKTDDPAWADRNGFCRIKPTNAAKWLQMQAAVA